MLNKTQTENDATYQWKYGVDISEITETISVSDIDPTITSEPR
mgnify:CR=1 FL=1